MNKQSMLVHKIDHLPQKYFHIPENYIRQIDFCYNEYQGRHK